MLRGHAQGQLGGRAAQEQREREAAVYVCGCAIYILHLVKRESHFFS